MAFKRIPDFGDGGRRGQVWGSDLVFGYVLRCNMESGLYSERRNKMEECNACSVELVGLGFVRRGQVWEHPDGTSLKAKYLQPGEGQPCAECVKSHRAVMKCPESLWAPTVTTDAAKKKRRHHD